MPWTSGVRAGVFGGRATEKGTSFLLSVLAKWRLKGVGAWEEEKAGEAGRGRRRGEKERKKAGETRKQGDRGGRKVGRKFTGRRPRGGAGGHRPGREKKEEENRV